MVNKISLGLSISSFVLILIMFVFGNIKLDFNLNFNEYKSVAVKQPIYQSDLDKEISSLSRRININKGNIRNLYYGRRID